MIDYQLAKTLRRYSLDVLNILHLLTTTKSFALETQEISQSTSTAESNLKGIITTLQRLKINDDSIVVPAGRDSDGRLRWRINEQIINKNDLAKFLEDEIFGKEVKWQQ